MPRPFLRTAPITVKGKQDYVQPEYSKNPSTLTPPPDNQPIDPYTIAVLGQQQPVAPVPSAIANALFAVASRGFQPQMPQQPSLPSLPQDMPPASLPQQDNSLFLGMMNAAPRAPARSFTQPDFIPPQPTPQPDMPAAATPLANVPGMTPQRPLQPFTQPDFIPPQTSIGPDMPDASLPHPSLPHRILQALGAPAEQQNALAPQISRTFPKATTPPVAKPEAKMLPTLRATPTTAADSLNRLSPLLKPAAPTGRKVVVSIPDKKMVVYDKNGSIFRQYPVYVGKADTPTPRGQFRIMDSLDSKFEWYYGPGFMSFAKDVHPGEKEQYYGFHGWQYTKDDDEEEKTNPGWKTSTHGCVQMGNKDVSEFATLVGVSDPVTILDTPLAPPPAPRPRVPVQHIDPMSSILRSLFSR